MIYPLVKTLLSQFIPAARPILDAASTRFGGELKSEDPYCVDVNFMKYLFGAGPSYCCPRF